MVEFSTFGEEGMVEEGFNVVDEVVIEDLTDVKEEKQLIPPSREVKLLVKKAEVKASKDNNYRWVNAQLQLVDGVDAEGKYKGKVVFGKICYYANMEMYGAKDYFKKKQHLVNLRQFAEAVGMDLAGLKINYQFIQDITGKMVVADILQTKGNEQYGPDNEVKNYKKVSTDSLV